MIGALGPYSLSGKTFNCQISWSLEAARFDVIMIVSLSNSWIAAAELPVKFQSDWKSLSLNLAASRLREIYDKTSYRLVNRGHGVVLISEERSYRRISQDLEATGFLFRIVSRASSGVSIVRVLEKIDRVLTRVDSNCIFPRHLWGTLHKALHGFSLYWCSVIFNNLPPSL